MQPLNATVLLPILKDCDPDSPDDLAAKRIDLLEHATSVIEGVSDSKSARPAIRELDGVAAMLQPVRERLRELPDPSDRARAELAARSEQLIRRLNAKASTIRSYPDLQKAVLGTMRA